MKRALHTAEIVGKAVGAEVRVENDLRECFYGDAEGKLIADLEREYPDILNNWYNPQYLDIRFPGGESKAEALNRVLARLDKLKTSLTGQWAWRFTAVRWERFSGILRFCSRKFPIVRLFIWFMTLPVGGLKAACFRRNFLWFDNDTVVRQAG